MERSIGGLNLTGVKRIDRAASFDCNPVSAEQRGTPGDSYFKGETNRVPGTTTAIKSAVTTGPPIPHINPMNEQEPATRCFVKHPMTINAATRGLGFNGPLLRRLPTGVPTGVPTKIPPSLPLLFVPLRFFIKHTATRLPPVKQYDLPARSNFYHVAEPFVGFDAGFLRKPER